MSKLRTGVLGVFAHLDSATDAIRRLRREGFEVTTYSPTPRHEIEEALEVPESPVRLFTLTGAFTGTAAGTALATWTSIDWPLIVGGKEIVSLPAFSVIMFELTILIGALSTVAGLFILGRLPHIGPPEAPMYHPSFTAGNFGVFAHAPRDRYDHVQTILSEAGSEEVLVDHR
ncbi:MAG TPA: DUF3341 domain-containing protein [Longimicrobiaceae bacterium]|nr:DUF3341 domain-containing protein [Longimicrobiaceae bacterium]